jgi:predicted secreted protein
MAKRIALKDHVLVDAVDLSTFARSVEFSSEHERVDVSGFNPTGANEYLAGQTEQAVTVEFYGSYGAGEVHATLYPIHRDREVVAFEWRPDQTEPVSPTNPQLEGNVQVLTYSPGATRGEADTFEVQFTAADENGLAFTDTP